MINKKNVDLAKVLNLELEPNDVQELVDYVGELSNKDLLELEEQCTWKRKKKEKK